MLKKYFDEATDSQGNPLTWPGTVDNFPFRGPPGTLKQEEFEQIPIVYDAKIDIFELPADKEKYEYIIDKCANGKYILRHEKIDYDNEKKCYRILLSWLEVFGESPEKD